MITEFKNAHAFLSNFYPVKVKFEGMVFPSVEHGFQAAKSLDLVERRKIAELPTAGRAKRHGRLVGIRNDWDSIKLGVMEFLLRQKFGKNSIYRYSLRDTYPEELVEGNTWGDTFWGAVWWDELQQWEGENHLGKLLMKIRQECLWDI